MSTNSDFSKPISFSSLVYRVVFENNTTTSESTVAPPNYAAITAFASASSKFYSSSFLPNIIEKDFGNHNGTKDPKLFEFFFGSNNLKKLLNDSTPSEDNINPPPPISTTLQFGRFLKLNANRFDEDLLLLLKSTPYFKRSLQKLTIYNPRTEHFMRSALEGMDRLDEINIEEIPKSNARVMSRAFKPLSTLPSLTSFSISSGFLPLNEDFFEAVGDLGEKVGTPLRKIKVSCNISYFNELNHNAFQNHFAGRLCAKKHLTHLSLEGIYDLINDDFDALIKAEMTTLQVLSLVDLGHHIHGTTAPVDRLTPNKIVEFVRSCSNEEFCELTLHNIKDLDDEHLTDLFSSHAGEDTACCPTTLDVELARTTYDGPSFIERLSTNYSDQSAKFFETLLFLRYRRRLYQSVGFVSALYKFDDLHELECSGLTRECFEAETTTEDNVTHKFLSGLTNLTKIVISDIYNCNTLPKDVPLYLPINFTSPDHQQSNDPPFLHLDLRFDSQQEHLQQLVTGTEYATSNCSPLTINENNRIKTLLLQNVASITSTTLTPLAKLPHLKGLDLPWLYACFFDKLVIGNFFEAREKENKKRFDDVVVSIRYDDRRFTKHDFKFDDRSGELIVDFVSSIQEATSFCQLADVLGAIQLLVKEGNTNIFTSEVGIALASKGHLINGPMQTASIVDTLYLISVRRCSLHAFRTRQVCDFILGKLGALIEGPEDVCIFAGLIANIAQDKASSELFSTQQTFEVLLRCMTFSLPSQSIDRVAGALGNILRFYPASKLILNKLPVVEAFSSLISCREICDSAARWVINALYYFLLDNEVGQKLFMTSQDGDWCGKVQELMDKTTDPLAKERGIDIQNMLANVSLASSSSPHPVAGDRRQRNEGDDDKNKDNDE